MICRVVIARKAAELKNGERVMIVVGEKKNLMYVIVRDYRARSYAPELGGVALADFREEDYAREYLKFLKRRWRATEKAYPGQHYEWRLYKRWDEYGDDGMRVKWELMEG